MLYQGAKIKDLKEKDKYLDWLLDLEYNKVGLPKPDIVFFLDVNSNITNKLTENRINKIDESNKKDIHECNLDLQQESYKNDKYLIDKYKWVNINCVKDKKMRDILSIHEDIYKEVKNYRG